MKAIGILLLALIFLGQTFRQPMVFISYQINKEQIIKTLCENKDKPQLKCEGKCHLRKQLKENSSTEPASKSNSGTEKIDLFTVELLEISAIKHIIEASPVSFSEALIRQPSSPLFRPPAV